MQTPQFETLPSASAADSIWQPVLALGRTVIRSSKEAIIATGVAVVSALAAKKTSGFWQLAAAWTLVELLFCGVQRYRYSFISGAPADDSCLDRTNAHMILHRLLACHELLPLKEFLSGWFQGAAWEDIKRENAREFLAYGFFTSPLEALPAEIQGDVDHFLHMLEQRHGVKLPPGRNPNIQFMAHLWEPLRVLPKPLLMYLTSEAVGLATDAALWAMGFKVHRCQGFRYWVRTPTAADLHPQPSQHQVLPKLRSLTSDLGMEARDVASTAAAALSGYQPVRRGTGKQQAPAAEARTPGLPLERGCCHEKGGPDLPPISPWQLEPRPSLGRASRMTGPWDSASSISPGLEAATKSSSPVFFMHGVGLGITPYLHFVGQIARTFNTRPMVLVECRHVSVNLTARAVTPDAVVAAMVQILRRHKWATGAFIGHSYGTFVLSRFVQLHKPLVESMVLIDPVCMFAIHPCLLQNFIYKLPAVGGPSGWNVLKLIDGIRYLFSRDMVIAESFCRKFAWHKVMLWPEAMADSSLLVLSAKDDLVPSSIIDRHLFLAGSPCKVICHPTASHGGFLLDHAFGNQVLSNIQEVLLAGTVLSKKDF